MKIYWKLTLAGLAFVGLVVSAILMCSCELSCETRTVVQQKPQPVCLRGHKEEREDDLMSSVLEIPMTKTVFVCDVYAPEKEP